MIKKMKYAGADYVVMPEALGGKEIVDTILKYDDKSASNSGKGRYYKSH